MAGVTPGNALVVLRLDIQRETRLCRGCVLVPLGKYGRYIVAADPSIDPSASGSTILFAEGQQFLRFAVPPERLYPDAGGSEPATGIRVGEQSTLEGFNHSAGVAAYLAAVDGGFLSAGSAGVELAAPGKMTSASSFQMVGGGSDDVLVVLREMQAGQSALVARLAAFEDGRGPSPFRLGADIRPPQVSFQTAPPGICAMQGAANLLGGAGGWGGPLAGLSSRPPSKASTVRAPLPQQDVRAGGLQVGGSDRGSDSEDPSDGEYNGPALIAEAAVQRRARRSRDPFGAENVTTNPGGCFGTEAPFGGGAPAPGVAQRQPYHQQQGFGAGQMFNPQVMGSPGPVGLGAAAGGWAPQLAPAWGQRAGIGLAPQTQAMPVGVQAGIGGMATHERLVAVRDGPAAAHAQPAAPLWELRQRGLLRRQQRERIQSPRGFEDAGSLPATATEDRDSLPPAHAQQDGDHGVAT